MPFNIDQDVAIAVLWGVTILAVLWTWLPALIASFGGTKYRNGATGDLTGLEPRRTEIDYQFWYDQLLVLGYEPLGRGWSRVNFAGHEWSLQHEVRVFRHHQNQTYAVVQKAPAPFHFWPGVVFATCSSDGRLLFTDNNEPTQPNPEDDFIRQGLVSLTLEPVQELHLATLEALRRLQFRPEPDTTIEQLFQSMHRHIGPEVRAVHGRAGTQFVFAHLLIHSCVSAPTGYVFGLLHWSVPLTNLVLAFVLYIGEAAQKRQFAAQVRAAFRHRLGPKVPEVTPAGDRPYLNR